ncbi:MAG: hypothetical protein JWP11_3839 [Frankiales bacterium]|nr:hypothetical protein [Frankiales bacterium]
MSAHRRAALLAALSFATALALPAMAGAEGSTITPTRQTVADPFRTGTEPTNALAVDGTVYESQIWGFTTTQSFLQRSLDGGSTFNTLSLAPGGGKIDPCTGGGDSALATGRNPGDVWMLDLGVLPEVPARVSADHGNSWTSNCVANFGDGVNFFADRQWLSTDLKNNVEIYLYRDTLGTAGEFIKTAPLPSAPGTAGLAQVQFASLCVRQGAVAAPCVTDTSTGGPPVTDNWPASPGYGTTYMPQSNTNGGMRLVRIRPGDSTTKVDESPKASTATPVLFPMAAVDRAGNVYLTWTDSSDYKVRYVYSKDFGQTWSAPVLVSQAPIATTVMPTIVAGEDGKIDIAYYGSNDPKAPTTNNGPWLLHMDQIFGADTAAPVQTHVTMSDRPVHLEPVCLSGLSCTTNTGPAGDRQLGDFFTMSLDKDGRAVISFADGDNQLGHEAANGLAAPSFAHLVRQATGPSLYGGDVPPLAVPTNAVTVTDHSNPVPLALPGTGQPGPDNDALKLLGSSLERDATGNLVVTLRVKKLDPVLAVTPPALPVATYLTRFVYNHGIYAVGAETEGGQWRYFAGPAAPVVAGTSVKAAYYPAATPLQTGSVDATSNTIRIVVPAAAVGSPGAADTLYSVTSYALTHALPTAPVAPQLANASDLPQIADALPAYNTAVDATTSVPESPFVVLLPLVGVALLALVMRRRRRAGTAVTNVRI